MVSFLLKFKKKHLIIKIEELRLNKNVLGVVKKYIFGWRLKLTRLQNKLQ